MKDLPATTWRFFREATNGYTSDSKHLEAKEICSSALSPSLLLCLDPRREAGAATRPLGGRSAQVLRARRKTSLKPEEMKPAFLLFRGNNGNPTGGTSSNALRLFPPAAVRRCLLTTHDAANEHCCLSPEGKRAINVAC